jgi:hypothetical protein
MMNNNHDLVYAIEISSSLLTDINFFALVIVWFLRAKSSRIMIAVFIFYVTRSILQRVVIFPFPDGFLSLEPAFPSLTVAYGRLSDFFYSGHVGFAIICALE